MPPGEARLVVAVPVGVALSALRRFLLFFPVTMNVGTHVSLLLVVGLMVAPYQSRILPLRSHLSWRAVAGAGGGEPYGRDVPNTKVFLRVRICFDGCAPICRRDGAEGGSAGGGGFCEVLSFRSPAAVLILDGVGPC